jgi:argininosuccinate lyase
LQEDKLHVFAASDNANVCLQMAEAIVSHTVFNTGRIAAGLDEGFLDATALAEYLVSKGVPFRQAHGIVGSLVSLCENEGRPLSDVPMETFREHSPQIDADVYD